MLDCITFVSVSGEGLIAVEGLVESCFVAFGSGLLWFVVVGCGLFWRGVD